MKYLCLVYHEETTIDALPKGVYDAIMNDVLAYREVWLAPSARLDELEAIGKHFAGDPYHFCRWRHFDVQLGFHGLTQQSQIAVLYVTAVAAKVNRDSIGSR